MEYYSIGELCSITKGSTGMMKAVPGPYPLVTTGPERKNSSEYEFDDEAVCIPLVSSTGHGHKSLNYIHFQSGKIALGTILAAVIPYINDLRFFIAKMLKGYSKRILSLTNTSTHGTKRLEYSQAYSTLLFPLPPQSEQTAIVERIEKFLSMVDELEKQAAERKEQSEQLMQAVLREAFEGKTNISDNRLVEVING